MLQDSKTSRACIYEYRMDFRLFVAHQKFSSESKNYCLGVKFPALKLKVYNFKYFMTMQ